MLSVVVVTFNSAKYIKPCLDSIFNQRGQDVETIVVDNGSKDGTVDFIKENYPQVRLIVNNKNLGACRARNQGIEVTSCEWVLTLDCDAVLEDGFIRGITAFARGSEDSTGIIQPKILTQDGKKIYSCGIRMCWLRRFYDIGRNLADTKKFDTCVSVFGACCAAAL